jgi:hypothetical protein
MTARGLRGFRGLEDLLISPTVRSYASWLSTPEKRAAECLGLMLDRGVAMLVNESRRDHRFLDVSNPHRT